MEHALTVIVLARLLTSLCPAAADTYSVRVGTESHVNLVDSKFLSFTIDPKYLFSSSGKYKTKECICMASSLTPAYIRIAGPSTSQTTFRNSTISIDALSLLDDGNSPQKVSLNEYHRDEPSDKLGERLTVTHDEWEQFVQWAKKTGFDLVFALNNEEKTPGGMWDPNTALNILTVADKAGIGDIFWQLGYACNNQSIEEYLNDLETLRVITETFPSADRWHVVGGDVTPCLAAHSESDFKDYVTLSDEMFDAVFLNGNSSSQELKRMSESDRLKLLRVLSRSDTPLWLTETNRRLDELERAADWMTSLGYSAKNGFAVHFRELVETELYEPTLSFYMALLFKNLVGEKVLNVDIEASDAAMFAHCTSLRRQPVPGAVTLYGVNVHSEPARFSIKLSKKEEGGDIMQFILGHDHSGNIMVNGRAMYYEGDIKPVVKRVRPYKTLLINLPPKSFGFWVLANTQVEACFEDDKTEEVQYVEALSVETDKDPKVMKNKRSVNKYDIEFDKESSIDFVELLNETDVAEEQMNGSNALTSRIHDLNHDLTAVRSIFSSNEENKEASDKMEPRRFKRKTYDNEIQNKKRIKSRRGNMKSRFRKQTDDGHTSLLKSKLISKLRQHNIGWLPKHDFSKLTKRAPKNLKARYKFRKENDLHAKDKNGFQKKTGNNKIESESRITNPDCDSLRKRKRRSTDTESVKINKDYSKDNLAGNYKRKSYKHIQRNDLEEKDVSSEYEVVDENEGGIPVKRVLHKLKKLTQIPVMVQAERYNSENDDLNEDSSGMDEIILKTKFLDDSAVINIKDKSKNGFLRSTMEDFMSILADFNKNLNKAWSVLTFLE